LKDWYIPFVHSLRIRTPRDEAELLRPVRVLAFARAFLALFSLAAIYIDPTEPTRYAPLAYSLMTLYVFYSLAALAFVRARKGISPWVPVLLHFVDLIWATVMTVLTEGPNSPFYTFFLFVLLAAAYRWGMRETVFTALGLAFLLLGQAYFVARSSLVDSPPELNRLIMRSTYMMLMSFLVGFLAEAEKQARLEATVSAQLLSRIRSEAGLRGALQAVFSFLLSLFGARRILLRLEDVGTGRRYLWEARPVADPDQCLVRLEEQQEAEPEAPLPRDPAWQAIRANGRLQFSSLNLRGNRWRNPEPAADSSQPFLESLPFATMMGVTTQFGQEWRGQLLVMDPHFGAAHPAELHFLTTLIRQAEPVIFNVYLYRRLRSRVGAIERARVARELHDGVIQSLVSLELQLEAVRGAAPEQVMGELNDIQRQLHQEVLAVRELMEQMKPVPVGPREMLDHLADRVDRFRRDSGISARFVTDLEEALMPARLARELVRILQEGLVNIRKHSGARNALVHFHARNGHWLLTIEDDGKGMEFVGRCTLAELDASRVGPVILKERVRSIHGELTIESSPGRGCRLEITVSQRPHG